MNMLDSTFRDSMMYWPPGLQQPDGTYVFTAPVGIKGRIDRNPVKVVTPQGIVLQVGIRYSTDAVLLVGGWLLETQDQPVTDTSLPTDFPNARQLLHVNVLNSFDGATVYYQGAMA